MKNRKVLPWILTVLIKYCVSSTTVSSDFTIHPSLDFTSDTEGVTTKQQDYTPSPSVTTELTKNPISSSVASIQAITSVSENLSSRTGSKLISDQTTGESTTFSNFGTDSVTKVASKDESVHSLSTTNIDSVIRSQTSFSDISTFKSAFSSLGTSESSISLSHSSEIGYISPSKTAYSPEPSLTSSVTNMKPSDSGQDTQTVKTTSTHELHSTEIKSYQSAETADSISASNAQSSNKDNFSTDISSPPFTSNPQTVNLPSAVTNTIIESSIRSSVLFTIVSETSVLQTDFLTPSVLSSVLLKPVIASSFSAEVNSTVSELSDSSDTSFILSPTSTLISVPDTLSTKSVLSLSETSEQFPMTTLIIGSSVSGSLIISQSSMFHFASTTIIPSPVSQSLDSILSVSSHTSSGQIDTDFVSVRTISSVTASKVSEKFTTASSDDLFGSEFSGKSSTIYSNGFGMSKETSLTSYLNTLYRTSLVISGSVSGTPNFSSLETDRDNTEMITISSTLTLLSNKISFSSTSRDDSKESSSLDLKPESTSEYDTVTSKLSQTDSVQIGITSSDYLQHSTSHSSVLQSLTSNILDVSSGATVITKTLHATETLLTEYTTSSNDVTFPTVSSSDNVYASKDFTTNSAETIDHMTKTSDTMSSVTQTFTSQFKDRSTTNRLISSRLLDTETLTSHFSADYTSMSSISPYGVSSPRLASSVTPSKAYSSSSQTGNVPTFTQMTDFSSTLQLSAITSMRSYIRPSSFSGYDETTKSVNTQETIASSASHTVSGLSLHSNYGENTTLTPSSKIRTSHSGSDMYTSYESMKRISAITGSMSSATSTQSILASSSPDHSRSISSATVDTIRGSSFPYSSQIISTESMTRSAEPSRSESLTTISTELELPVQTSVNILLSSLSQDTSSAHLTSGLSSSSIFISSKQYMSESSIKISKTASLFDQITSSSTQEQTTSVHLDVSTSSNQIYSFFSSGQMTKSAYITQSTDVLTDSVIISLSSSQVRQTNTFEMFSTESAYSDSRTSTPPLNSLTTKVLLSSLISGIDATRTSDSIHVSTNTGFSTKEISTTLTSFISLYSFLSLGSQTQTFEQTNSLLTDSFDSVLFLTASSSQTRTSESTADLSSKLMVSSSVIITPSKASSSIALGVSTSEAETSTFSLNTIGNTSVYLETSVKATGTVFDSFTATYSTFKYISTGKSSFSIFNDTGSQVITLSQDTLLTQVTSTFDAYSDTSVFIISSHSISSALPRTSLDISSAIALSTSLPNISDMPSLDVLTDSKITTLTTSPKSLVSPARSTIVSGDSSVTISPSNVFKLSQTTTGIGSMSSLFSLTSISSVIVSSSDSQVLDISTPSSVLATQESILTETTTPFTIRLESSFVTSVTYLSMFTDSVEFSTTKDSSVYMTPPTSSARLDSSLFISLSNYSLYTNLDSSFTLNESLTTLIPLTSTVKSESSIVSPTPNLSLITDSSVTLGTTITETLKTFLLSTIELFSSSSISSQFHLTVSGVSEFISTSSEVPKKTKSPTESLSFVTLTSTPFSDTSFITSDTTSDRSSTVLTLIELPSTSLFFTAATIITSTLSVSMLVSESESTSSFPSKLYSSRMTSIMTQTLDSGLTMSSSKVLTSSLLSVESKVGSSEVTSLKTKVIESLLTSMSSTKVQSVISKYPTLTPTQESTSTVPWKTTLDSLQNMSSIQTMQSTSTLHLTASMDYSPTLSMTPSLQSSRTVLSTVILDSTTTLTLISPLQSTLSLPSSKILESSLPQSSLTPILQSTVAPSSTASLDSSHTVTVSSIATIDSSQTQQLTPTLQSIGTLPSTESLDSSQTYSLTPTVQSTLAPSVTASLVSSLTPPSLPVQTLSSTERLESSFSPSSISTLQSTLTMPSIAPIDSSQTQQLPPTLQTVRTQSATTTLESSLSQSSMLDSSLYSPRTPSSFSFLQSSVTVPSIATLDSSQTQQLTSTLQTVRTQSATATFESSLSHSSMLASSLYSSRTPSSFSFLQSSVTVPSIATLDSSQTQQLTSTLQTVRTQSTTTTLESSLSQSSMLASSLYSSRTPSSFSFLQSSVTVPSIATLDSSQTQQLTSTVQTVRTQSATTTLESSLSQSSMLDSSLYSSRNPSSFSFLQSSVTVPSIATLDSSQTLQLTLTLPSVQTLSPTGTLKSSSSQASIPDLQSTLTVLSTAVTDSSQILTPTLSSTRTVSSKTVIDSVSPSISSLQSTTSSLTLVEESSFTIATRITRGPTSTLSSTIHTRDSIITEVISTPVKSHSTTVSLTHSTMTGISTNTLDIKTSTISISSSLPFTSMTLLLPNTSVLTVMSITRSVPVSASSVTPTTTIPPETTTLNVTNARERYWVRLVLKIQQRVNVSDPSFKRDIENGLARAFNEAFIREKLIEEGKFEPLNRRRRRKRYTNVGDVSIQIHDISRTEGTTEVTIDYAVEKSGKVLSAQEAVAALDVLDTQELAIILKQVVDVKAEPYIQTETPSEPEKDDSQIWLYAVIAGSIAAVILAVWIIVCIYCKCCRHKNTEEDAEPELTSIHRQSSKRKLSHTRPLPTTPHKKTLVPQSSKFSLRKGRTYEINDGYMPEKETEEITLLKTPTQKKIQSPPSSINGSTANTPVMPKKELVPPAVKKGRRNSKNSIGPTNEDMYLNNENTRLSSSKGDRSQLFQQSISEDSEDTRNQLKAEKKKNKERLSEKYGQEIESKNQAKEKDNTESKILGMPNTAVPSFLIESGSPSKEPLPLSRKNSDGNNSADENLEEARSRMHKLLDDAFSLISPRSSFSENDLRKSNGTDSTKPLGQTSNGNIQSAKDVVDVDKAIETLKGFTNPAYTSSYSQFLETWSPYRASDQVALISMPHKPEPVVTRLGGKSAKRQISSNTTSNIGRRPAANLDLTYTKSVNDINESGKYTTSAPKPIVIRTKDDIHNPRLESAKSYKSSNEIQNNRNFSATALNGDILLRGSSTALTKTTPQSKPKLNDSLEMQPVRRNRSNSIRKHREPEKDNRNRDEIDVIKNIKPEEASDKLFQSLRSEIKGSKADTEEDINKKPIRRKNRKTNSKPMTDIM